MASETHQAAGTQAQRVTEKLRAPARLSVEAFGLTDRGRRRENNEDQFLIAQLTKTMHIWQTTVTDKKLFEGEEPAHLFLVADGMGGHRAGERASALAVAAIGQFTLNTFKWFFSANETEIQRALGQFRAALATADQRILDESIKKPELSGMGTTVTMAFQHGTQLCVVHAGDSRCYLLRDGALDQLTEDHTLVAEMVKSGALTPDEARGHRMGHVITNVVGGGERGVDVEVRALEVQAGDKLLLCSDGLNETLTDARITTILKECPTPEAAAHALVNEANDHGGRDNITVIVARFAA